MTPIKFFFELLGLLQTNVELVSRSSICGIDSNAAPKNDAATFLYALRTKAGAAWSMVVTISHENLRSFLFEPRQLFQ
jgi:hypothetical protein